MGAVYRAFDKRRRADVALKMLQRASPERLISFKSEFRSLAGIVHPNLVTLYELGSLDDVWFFTMELVAGTDFLDWVRPYRATLPQATGSGDEVTHTISSQTSDTLVSPGSGGSAANVARREAIASAVLDVERLRTSFSQLAGAVRSLHRAGRMHRDLKPSNVLVARGERGHGRVVVCDFGLVADIDQGVAAERRQLGTPLYMSPEQAAGAALSPATDWYSAGVMLFEALTGKPPFTGSVADVLSGKQETAAPRVADLTPNADPRLASLADDLLERDPEARPDGEQIRARLDDSRRRRPTTAVPGFQRPTRERFVGRRDELAALRDLASQARGGAVTVGLVSGRSGIGKSTLVSHFLDELRGTGDADGGFRVLRGRCYERESVPFKALDSLVDALASVLLAMPESSRAALLPADAAVLSRVFPSLEAVVGFQEGDGGDVADLRRRAFAALRSLFRELARERPLVLFIDDLQWGDIDSAPFLASLVLDSKPAPLLLLATFRAEERDSSPLLRALLAPDAPSSLAARARTIELAGLDDAEAKELVVAADGGADTGNLDQLLQEAGGHPLFLAELARARARGDVDSGRFDLDQLLGRRIESVGVEARALLAASALAGRPMPLSVLCRAADVKDEPAAVAVLVARDLARTAMRDDVEELEVFHQRVLATCLGALSDDEQRQGRRGLARALESSARVDPLELLEQWLGAGEPARAGRYAIEAAARAERALAFDQAAYAYEKHLELTQPEAGERLRVLTSLGDMLANAGRLADAADRYLEAAELASPEQATALRCRAAEELIRFGQVTRGIDLARRALEEVGVSFPRSKVRIIAGILLRRAWLRVRGEDHAEKPPSRRDAQMLRRIDACQAVAGGLSFVLPVHGAFFQTKSLLWALEAGDPRRAAMAYGLDLGFRSLPGAAKRGDAQKLTERARALGRRFDSHGIVGFATGGFGVASFLFGDFATGQEHCEKGVRMLALDTGPGLRWQRSIIEVYGLCCGLYLGRIGELCNVVRRRLREALESGDEYAAVALRAWRTNLIWLASDEPDEAERQALLGAPDDTSGTFTIQHYYQMLALCQIDLYRGNPTTALERVETGFELLRKKSMHLRLQTVRVEGHYLLARCQLAAMTGKDASATRRARAVVGECIGKLDKEDVGWARALAALLRAGAARGDGDHARSVELFEQAASLCEKADLGMHAMAARWHLAALRGDDDLAASVLDWARAESVANPTRFFEMTLPLPVPDQRALPSG